MEPAADLVLQPAEIAVSLRQQLQHTRLIVSANGSEIIGSKCGETFSPLAQPDGLGGSESHSNLVEDVFVAVDRDSSVAALVRVEPDGDGYGAMPFAR
jgi:hypothetical protein